jgi:hypothetical protein
MKAIKTLCFIFLCSVELVLGAEFDKDSPGDHQVVKSTGLEARYDFSISFGSSDSDFPESIVVTIKGQSDSIRLNGLLFEFIASSGSYWAYNDDLSSTKTPLNISKDSTFSQAFRLEDLQFQSFKTKKRVSFTTFKEAMPSNQVIKVLASIGDRSRATNPYESNLYARSNVIEFTKRQSK